MPCVFDVSVGEEAGKPFIAVMSSTVDLTHRLELLLVKINEYFTKIYWLLERRDKMRDMIEERR